LSTTRLLPALRRGTSKRLERSATITEHCSSWTRSQSWAETPCQSTNGAWTFA
jgi:hypothetical protein